MPGTEAVKQVVQLVASHYNRARFNLTSYLIYSTMGENQFIDGVKALRDYLPWRWSMANCYKMQKLQRLPGSQRIGRKLVFKKQAVDFWIKERQRLKKKVL